MMNLQHLQIISRIEDRHRKIEISIPLVGKDGAKEQSQMAITILKTEQDLIWYYRNRIRVYLVYFDKENSILEKRNDDPYDYSENYKNWE